MANYISVNKEAFSDTYGNLQNVIRHKMNFSILRYSAYTLRFLQGFEKRYTTAIKRKLKKLSPNYVVSGDIQKSEKLIFATTTAGGKIGFGDVMTNQRSGEYDRFFTFNLRLPEHRGNAGKRFQYGYALGDENARLRADLDVLTQWVFDKRKSGKFILNGKPVETMQQALSVAYLINRKRYGDKIRNKAPQWYSITDEVKTSNIMKSLANLKIFKEAWNKS